MLLISGRISVRMTMNELRNVSAEIIERFRLEGTLQRHNGTQIPLGSASAEPTKY